MLQQLQLRISRNQPILLFAVALISLFAIFWPHARPEPAVTQAVVIPPVIPTPVPTAEVQDKATIVLELFNPSDMSLTHQLNETNISQQVEQVMATSYILSHCKLLNDDEYRDTFRAVIIFAQHSGLAPDMTTAEVTVRRLAESAGVTYSLLYRRTDCRNPQLSAIQRQLTNWRKIYLRE